MIQFLEVTVNVFLLSGKMNPNNRGLSFILYFMASIISVHFPDKYHKDVKMKLYGLI